LELNTLITSNSVNISGITGDVPVSISGLGSPQISINNGSWETSGTINNGDSLQARLTSNNNYLTANTATVTLGTESDDWTVTTKPETFGNISWALAGYANNNYNPGRFVNEDENGNANTNLVHDNATGLVWVRDGNLAGATKTWSQALDYCKNQIGTSGTYQGFSDWRLPDGNELNSIMDFRATIAPYIYQGADGFTNTVSNFYLSATTRPSDTTQVLGMGFDSGVAYPNSKSGSFYVRCVR